MTNKTTDDKIREIYETIISELVDRVPQPSNEQMKTVRALREILPPRLKQALASQREEIIKEVVEGVPEVRCKKCRLSRDYIYKTGYIPCLKGETEHRYNYSGSIQQWKQSLLDKL